MHRFLWDVHYQPLPGGGGGRGGLPIAAVQHDTVPAPSGPWAPPGQYTVKLTVDGKSYTQPLTLKMDPRVTTPALGLAQQFTLSKQLYDGILGAQKTLEEIRARRANPTASMDLRATASKDSRLPRDALTPSQQRDRIDESADGPLQGADVADDAVGRGCRQPAGRTDEADDTPGRVEGRRKMKSVVPKDPPI
jgi:hypothetical protein